MINLIHYLPILCNIIIKYFNLLALSEIVFIPFFLVYGQSSVDHCK